MSRVVVTAATASTTDGYTFRRGDCVELTAAQVTALGTSVRPVTYRDQLGERSGASNST